MDWFRVTFVDPQTGVITRHLVPEKTELAVQERMLRLITGLEPDAIHEIKYIGRIKSLEFCRSQALYERQFHGLLEGD